MLEARESAATFAKLTPLQPKIAALRKLILSQLGEGTLMRYLLLPFTPRYILFTIAILGTFTLAAIGLRHPGALPALALPLAAFGALVLLGICDLIQTRHAILRNYPIAAHIRFILEHIRPELRQYFFEAERDGTPFPRDKRALVYQRAKQQLDTRPFGTHYDVYRDHYEWLHHSIQPKQPASELFRTTIGGAECTKPYSASVFNISAMSYGSLSANAIRALNKGAKLGDFAHDTGEGGVSRYHRSSCPERPIRASKKPGRLPRPRALRRKAPQGQATSCSPPSEHGPRDPCAGLIPVKVASSQAHTLAIEMKPLPHSYEVTLTGGPTGYATIATDGVPPLSSAPPKDFDGPGDAWSPEHLLLASVEACFMFTFRAVARGSNFDFIALDLSAHGIVDREDGATRFTEIVLKPRLTLPKGADPERAHRVLDKGKTACLVTASLSVPVRLEAEILAAA